jgi:predicted dehydrogenase
MTTAERPMGVAMIGTGMVARTHLSAIRDADVPVRLVGVLSRSTDRAGRFAAEAAGELGAEVTVYSDVAAICRDDRVDIALILTPPDARRSLIAPLAAAGKAVLLEKPVGRTLAEAEDVVTLCEAAGVPLGIVFQHRMREASVAAKALVGSGRLGALGLAEISVPWWREQAYYDEPGRGTYGRDGGGVLISQAIHTMDLALTLTGPVTCVTAMTGTTGLHRMEAEDVAVSGLRFANGALGWLTASTASFPGTSESITLHFERGSLRLAEGVLHVDWRDGRTETHGAAATTGGGADPMAFTHDWHTWVLEDFVNAVTSGQAPAIAGRDALAAHQLIHAITVSAETGTRFFYNKPDAP